MVTLPFFILGLLISISAKFSNQPPFTTLEFLKYFLALVVKFFLGSFLFGLVSAFWVQNFSARTWEQYIEKAKEELTKENQFQNR